VLYLPLAFLFSCCSIILTKPKLARLLFRRYSIMPTAIEVLVKEGRLGGGLERGEHELCEMSYDSSDETEVIVLIKTEGGRSDESIENERTGSVPTAYSLSGDDDGYDDDDDDDDDGSDCKSSIFPPPVMDNKCPLTKTKTTLKRASETESGWSNNMVTRQVRGGDSKENASPQKERTAAMGGRTKVALFVNGGGSEKTSFLLHDVKDYNDNDVTFTTSGKYGRAGDGTILGGGGSWEARDAVIQSNKDSALKGGNAFPLENIEVPGVNDCLSVRGRGPYYHWGGKRYRKWPDEYCKLVESKKDDYRNAHHANKSKHSVAFEIVHEWRALDPPGRFLKQDKQTGKWNDVGDLKAMKKVMDSLKEKTPPRLESISGDYSRGSELKVESALSYHTSATLTLLRQTAAKGEKSEPEALMNHVREETVTVLRNANYSSTLSFPLSRALSEAENDAVRLMREEMRLQQQQQQQQQQHQKLDTINDWDSKTETFDLKSKRPRSGYDNGQSKKRTKKQCSHEGCDKHACRGQEVCWKHGANTVAKRCSSEEGCTNYAVKGGVCIRHGAKMNRNQCSSEGCANIAIKGGVCKRHGTKGLA